jgi:hypothetical protein
VVVCMCARRALRLVAQLLLVDGEGGRDVHQ